MMRSCHLHLIVVVLVLTSVSCQGSLDGDAPSSDSLDGRWEVVSLGGGGVDPNFSVRISGNRFLGTFPGAEIPVMELTLRLDPSTSPARVDVDVVFPEDHLVGIYELKDDILKICLDEPDNGRPGDFEVNEEDSKILYVFKRAKGPSPPGAWDFTPEEMDQSLQVVEELKNRKIMHQLARPLGQLFVMFGQGEANEETLALLTPCSLQMKLYMPRADLSDAAIKSLASLKNVFFLDLVNTELKDDDLSFLANLPGLVQLELSGTSITDAALVHVSHLPHLSILRLSTTHITGEGLKHLLGCRELRDISLDSTELDDIGLRHLSELPNLHTITAGHTHVTDEGIMHLANSLRLQALYVPETNVTEAGAERLEKAHAAAREKSEKSWEGFPPLTVRLR